MQIQLVSFAREIGDEPTDFCAAYEVAAQRTLTQMQEPEPEAIRRQKLEVIRRMRLVEGVTTDVSLEDELQHKKAEAMERLRKRIGLMRDFLQQLVTCDGNQQWASVTYLHDAKFWSADLQPGSDLDAAGAMKLCVVVESDDGCAPYRLSNQDWEELDSAHDAADAALKAAEILRR